MRDARDTGPSSVRDFDNFKKVAVLLCRSLQCRCRWAEASHCSPGRGRCAPALSVMEYSRPNLIPVAAGCLGLSGFAVAMLAGVASNNPADIVLTRAILSLVACSPIGAGLGWVFEIIIVKHQQAVLQELAASHGHHGQHGHQNHGQRHAAASCFAFSGVANERPSCQ